jgi:hypothetical protein
MLRYLLFFFCMAWFSSFIMAQPATDSFLQNLLLANRHPIMQQVLQDPQTYRVQIIYTQIDRDAANKPLFKHFYFNHDGQLYFNPASMVKLPLALLSLEKLNSLKAKGIDKYTTLQFDSSFTGQEPLTKDSTAPGEGPTIAHFIKRAFLISENDPYNRMYQFVGQQQIHQRLHQKGYKDVRIVRQFAPHTEEQNRRTPSIRFLKEDGTLLYRQPPAYNRDSFDFSREIKLGHAHYNRDDSLIEKPFDFTRHNNLPLQAIQQMLQSVMFPQSLPATQRFNLTEDDYTFLYQYLSQYPSETPYPKYDTSAFYDSYVKFFFRDSTHQMPEGVRVFNKVGWSYGFLTDVSYVADFNNGVEYMLSATVYVNKDGILNDGKYDYDTVGYPFLYQLGQTVYQHELKRQRTPKPDLSHFQVTYEKRDPTDTRPSLKEVDN